ncbi:MAG: 16S rRNA (uracil(1498)-N(3))-methyltransferase [Pseudomonadales bacterium]|nr:16S rRNA (uracil(1498)-N(3))-methyltransferase [Pseudomonadales bacterium]MDG2035503.1 16S rRNA (uracil(1498)-N(3))-methyltransferase [Pseudomonadales bacterium]
MRRSRIYCEQEIQLGQSMLLDSRNSHYLLHVLRVKENQTLVLFDGHGSDYLATINKVSRKDVSVVINEKIADVNTVCESPLYLTLAIAISKGERMDWVMQKATELGVNCIQPLITQRVDVKLNAERLAKKMDHWRGVVIGACEQSGRSVLPELEIAKPITSWVANDTSDLKLVLRAHGNRLTTIADGIIKKPSSATILIGPEGGLDENELSLAESSGFIAAGFGPRILRTETAPIVALSLLQERWGDF